jgi:DNA-binding NarL/FixJ family response regulator
VGNAIRVAVVSRQRLIGEALTALLGDEAGMEIAGEAVREAEAVALVHDSRPDVVLIDLSTPGLDDLQLLRTIRQQSPDTKLLLLTASMNEALIRSALTAGAKGYVSTEAGASDLRKAIRGVHDGDFWVERRVLVRWLRGDASGESRGDESKAKGALTAREREILKLLASGGTNKEIARVLYISEKTVKTHLNSIFRKLQVTRRLQAVLYAVRQGLR